MPACALFFPATASPALADEATSGGRVQLEAGKMSSDGHFQFSFAPEAGQTYAILASIDLVHWGLLTNVLAGRGPLWVTDIQARNFQHRFYRISDPDTPTNMVFIRPGTFTMGTPASEEGHDATEGPQTVVTLSRGFWMGKYEVSQQDYVGVMGTNASFFTQDPRLPADAVTWSAATNYCHNLTQRERTAGRLPAGHIYRLPTEAEWEYACRAGTTTPFGVGNGTSLSSVQANFDGNFPYGGAALGPHVNRTTLPGSYGPNAWGLYDMHGNVWEWCQDWYGAYPGGEVTDPKGPATGSERVLRGGGYTDIGKSCRSAERASRWVGHWHPMNGFRVVLAPNP